MEIERYEYRLHTKQSLGAIRYVHSGNVFNVDKEKKRPQNRALRYTRDNTHWQEGHTITTRDPLFAVCKIIMHPFYNLGVKSKLAWFIYQRLMWNRIKHLVKVEENSSYLFSLFQQLEPVLGGGQQYSNSGFAMLEPPLTIRQRRVLIYNYGQRSKNGNVFQELC